MKPIGTLAAMCRLVGPHRAEIRMAPSTVVAHQFEAEAKAGAFFGVPFVVDTKIPKGLFRVTTREEH